MTRLVGADIVLPDAVFQSATLVIEDGRVAAIEPDSDETSAASPLHGCLIVPGFVDVHVHGVDGTDTLDAGDGVARIAAALPRFGVTAFCPTLMACGPDDLRRVLMQVRRLRAAPPPGSARVLPAHLESSFINPEYRGAQPAACLRTFAPLAAVSTAFSAGELLRVMDDHADEIAVVTIAPEMPGGVELISWLRARGMRVALGHSAASYDQARAAIAFGATHATHLFNRMPPLHHRQPGLAGAVLESADVAAEVICDGVHVHPSLVRMIVAAKGTSRVMAITDGTALSGLPVGARAALGGQSIVATDTTATLADGTLAGSVLTMDAAFRCLVRTMGFSAVDAATLCSTTPARELQMDGIGAIVEGAVADLAILDPNGVVAQTWRSGRVIYDRRNTAANSSRPATV
jgi:N-acetylglucosamine-6-phosphate deacetylase